MKALGKILGLVILGLLLIIVALGFALTHLFDPNDYKDEIRQLARDKAGVELSIDGDIGWSLFPWLGLQLHDTTLAAAQSPDQPFARLRMLGLSVRVMPLLSREIRMSDITLEGLDLTLVRDAQGNGNWEGIGPQAEPTPDDAPASTEPAAEGRRPLALDIDSLTINDARVSYQDATTGQQFSAEGIRLVTGAIREGAPVPLELSAFFGSNQPVVRARSNLQATLRFDTQLKRYQLDGLNLDGEVSGEPFNGKTLAFGAQGELLVDLAAQIAEWNSLKLSANQVRALGQLSMRDLQGEPKLSGTLSVARFDLGEFLPGIGVTLPTMSAADALAQVELVTRLVATSDSLALEDLELQVDGTRLTGRVAVEDFARQALRVALKGDRLDLDRYLPPPSEAEQASEAARDEQVRQSEALVVGAGTTPLPDQPTTPAWSEEDVLPVAALRELDAVLALDLQQLTVAKLPLQDFSLRARGQQGLLQLESLRSRLYGGGLETSARLDLRPSVPLITLEKRLSGIALEPLLAAQALPVSVKGKLNLTADLATRGNSQRAWVDNLSGRIRFAIENGTLMQANLEQQICRAIATLNRKALSSEPRGKDTPFRELSGTLEIRDGVASNRDLRVAIPGIAVNGRGDVDLRVLGMDYRIGVVIEGDKSDMPDPACQVNQRYVGLEWPLRCRGPLELGARACRLDEEGLGRIAAKLAGDKLSETIEKKLGDKVSPELKDALKGLFDR